MTGISTYPAPPASLWESLRYCHDPLRVGYHFAQVRRAERMLVHLTGSDRGAVRAAMREIGQDGSFLADLFGRYRAVIGHQARAVDFMFLGPSAGSLLFHGIVQYALVRLLKPEVVVETGGTPGNSSAFMLRAMDCNGRGELHTVDLPPSAPLEDSGTGAWLHQGMPTGQTSGWAVPQSLRARHRQHLGDARDLLPDVFDHAPTVDVFVHDSDHSYQHMMWEFATAWPHVRAGGVLLSDDVRANRAFAEFAAAQGLPAFYTGGLGAIRKPR